MTTTGTPTTRTTLTTTVRTDRSSRGRGRWAPRAARTRIIGWVLLLVLLSLAAVVVVTWRLLVAETDERMTASLQAEVAEFRRLVATGIDPRTGAAFASVDDVLSAVLTYNQARPNEKFLAYVDGVYRYQSRIEAPVRLSDDPAFTELVGSVTESRSGSYASGAGEVLYVAVPVSFPGSPESGVVVAAFFADLEREAADSTARLMLLVGGLTSLAAAGGAWVVAGRILRPVRDVAATAQGITETDLSGRIEVAEGPGDELADLARSVNGMLDRVESGVAAQRRFLDDAGHELRTPITIVRGHLEVLDPADPADVRGTVALVDDELDRMNRIVSDLLLLARAEQPAFVRPHPVDVAALTAEVARKVQRLGDRDWVLEAAADVDAVLDPQRVTQALVALADNAVHVTGPATASASAAASSTASCACGSPTRVRAWRPRTGSGSSSASAAGRPVSGAARAPGWAWRSCPPSPPRTAAGCPGLRARPRRHLLPRAPRPPGPARDPADRADATVDESTATAEDPHPAGGTP